MGRAIKRVPLDFVFPLEASWCNTQYDQHMRRCKKPKDERGRCSCQDLHQVDTPKGDGWQLWMTVDDSPLTPVFATPEELIEYMSQPVPDADRKHWDEGPFPSHPRGQGWNRDLAERFVRAESRSFGSVYTPGRGWEFGAAALHPNDPAGGDKAR